MCRTLDDWHSRSAAAPTQRDEPLQTERALIAAARTLATTASSAHSMRAGAPLDHVNNLGWTALIESIVLGDGGPRRIATMKALIDGGADINRADRQRRDTACARAWTRLRRDGGVARRAPALAQRLASIGAVPCARPGGASACTPRDFAKPGAISKSRLQRRTTSESSRSRPGLDRPDALPSDVAPDASARTRHACSSIAPEIRARPRCLGCDGTATRPRDWASRSPASSPAIWRRASASSGTRGPNVISTRDRLAGAMADQRYSTAVRQSAFSFPAGVLRRASRAGSTSGFRPERR